MSSYDILYFEYAGNAYLTRAMLSIAGIPYKNVYPAWPDEKPNMPYGRLPVLRETNSDGSTFEICESSVIERYIAHKYGFLPQDLQKTATLEQYIAQIYDSFEAWADHKYVSKNEESKKKLVEVVSYLLEKHEPIIKRNPSGFYFGDSISLVDLSLYYLYILIKYLKDEDIGVFSEIKFPSINRLLKLVSENVEVQSIKITNEEP